MSRPTVHDVARAAGVSLSTVDRVLNGREGVRRATRLRVHEVMEQLGYQRNIAAANLSKRREYRIRILLPAGENAFMRGLEDEVAAYRAVARFDGTRVEVERVPAFDEAALAAALRAVDADVTDGVAVVATDAAGVRDAVAELKGRGVRVVTLVSDLPTSARDYFIGIDNVFAGRTAAGLLGRFCRGRPGEVAIVAGSMVVRDHAERRLGFEQVMRAEFPDQALLPPLEGLDEAGRVEGLLREVLQAHPGITGVYSLGAGNRGVMAALKGLPVAERPSVVVHELTPHSRQGLLDGTLDAVIQQDPAREVRCAVHVLRALVDGQPVDPAQERVGIEVFLRDNLP